MWVRSCITLYESGHVPPPPYFPNASVGLHAQTFSGDIIVSETWFTSGGNETVFFRTIPRLLDVLERFGSGSCTFVSEYVENNN
jgi:hypothetical protein